MKYDACTDEELIERLRQGETEITDYILEKYKPLVRKYANAMYLIGGETDDLIQEGMIGLFKAIRDFCLDKDSSFFHFAGLCIHRQLYSAIEASNRKKHQPLNSYLSFFEQGAEGSIGFTSSPEQLVIEQEVSRDLWNRVNSRLYADRRADEEKPEICRQCITENTSKDQADESSGGKRVSV